jgi:hypothetical protein
MESKPTPAPVEAAPRSKPAAESAEAAPRPRRRARFMRVVRRLHMYLGLLLFPWVLFFGISGMLFNHPHVGRPIQTRGLSAEEVRSRTGFAGWKPEDVANAILAQLNQTAGAGVGGYTLDPDVAPRFFGFSLFASPAQDGGRYMMILDLEKGRAGVGKRPPPAQVEKAPLDGLSISDTPYSTAALSEKFQGLLQALGEHPKGELKPHPEVHPELRFVVRDASGERLHVSYDLTSHTLASRPAQADLGVPLVEIIEKLHTQHHFPTHPGMTLFWAIFADLTGLTLVLWALTGLVMWWQMKPTRVTGAIVIAVALGLAVVVMAGTAEELTFMPPAQGGP